jgi:hypothetical protein
MVERCVVIPLGDAARGNDKLQNITFLDGRLAPRVINTMKNMLDQKENPWVAYWVAPDWPWELGTKARLFGTRDTLR